MIDHILVSIVILFVKTALYLRVSTIEQSINNKLPDLEAVASRSRSPRPCAIDPPAAHGVEPCHRPPSMRQVNGPKMGMVEAWSG